MEISLLLEDINMLKSTPLLLGLILTLKHYGIAVHAQNVNNMVYQNLNDICTRSQNQSLLEDRGTISVNFTGLKQYPAASPFQCNFTIRSNRSMFLIWYDISKVFQGDFENCSETKNIIKVFIGLVLFSGLVFT